MGLAVVAMEIPTRERHTKNIICRVLLIGPITLIFYDFLKA